MRIFISLLFCFILFCCAGLSAQQQSYPVIIDDTVVMRLYDTPGSPGEQAAANVTKRLEDKINAGASSKALVLKDAMTATSIYWGDTLILTVTKEQARRQQSEHKDLAALWLKNILSVVGEDSLKVSRPSMQIALSESETNQVLNGSGDIQAKYDTSKLEVEVLEDGSFVCTALAVGDHKISLRRGASKCVIRVKSRQRAGSISGTIEQIVTGNPVPQDLLIPVAVNRAVDGVRLNPGAQVFIKSDPVILQPLPSRSSVTVTVPVIIEGNGYFPFEGSVPIVIKNEPIEWTNPNYLFVCNRPEEVSEDGTLFRDSLTLGQSARLLYSHKNGSPARRRIALVLTNKNLEKTRVLVRRAAAGPDKYEMNAGHRAAVRYMTQYMAQSGYVLELKARESIILEDFDITAKFIVSGLCDFQLLEGKELEVSVHTVLSGNSIAGLPKIERPFDPFKIHPHGTFPSPDIFIEHEYAVSDTPLEIEVGKWPWLIDNVTGEPNTGNFGVIYKLKVKLTNPLSRPIYTDLIYTPLNGTSQGTILVNGKLLETPIIRKDEPCSIGRFKLSSKESSVVEIVTIPEAASCYPIKFTFVKGD